jgi:FAD/FMN-containing dehydrogenase
MTTTPTATHELIDMRAVDGLRYDMSVRGDVIAPGDPEYDAARAVWNGSIDRHPLVVARCADVGDVQATVRLADAHRHLPLAVRGGGHNVAGFGTCDAGIVLDLSPMRAVLADPSTGLVRAQGGARLGDLDHAAGAFGLAVPAGVVSHTGIGGLTLGGGVGYLSRRYGYSCDALRACGVVTASGDYVVASETENADLFWGLRGGGGNFGIVCEFTYQGFEERTVLAGNVIHAGADALDVLRFYQERIHTAPRELYAHVILTTGAEPLPEHLHGELIAVLFVLYAGDVRDAEEALRPWREHGRPEIDWVEPRTYVEQQRENDVQAWSQYEMRNYWKAAYLTDLDDAAMELMVEHAREAPSPLSFVMVHPLGGAIDDLGEDDTAVSYRGARHSLLVDALHLHAEDDDRQRAWARGAHEALRPWFSGGAYVNYLADGDQATVRAAYGDAKYERLVQLKDRFDPGNRFSLNQNIRPSEVTR